jgi:GDP-4-dehydro-6-deoxy-D-mannose reductase
MVEQKTIVVTGVHGFVGGHLARELHEQGYKVHGIGREETAADSVSEFLGTYSQCDFLDVRSTEALVFDDATAIIHLAGLASPADSFKYPERYKNDNRTMTDNLLKAAAGQSFEGRVVAISTGAVYDPNQPMPLNESSATTQGSPYSIGKLAAEAVALEHKSAGMDVVVARPFNHTGPGQAKGFLVSDLYDQVKLAEAEGTTSISVGNLATRRDYTDVRDIVRAYILLATAPSLHYPIYNIASGNSYSGYDILDKLKDSIGYKDVKAIVDPSRVRPTDAEEIVGDASRIRNELDWKPSIPLSQTIDDFIVSKR